MALAHRDHPWTYDDLATLPDDGRRWEIIAGELWEMTGPTLLHARVVRNLIELLLPILGALRAEWYTAPVDVFFRDADPVQPDLFAVLPGGAARQSRRGIEGAPDLVVEVLSPSTRERDELTKRALYGIAGVREYWLVDPERRTVEVLTLDRDALHGAGRFAGDEAVVSALLPGVGFAASALFAGLDEIAGDAGVG